MEGAKTYHILNGDALKEKFPKSLGGECIVIHECLVDGPVNGETLEEFYKTRESYLTETYGDQVSDISYTKDVIPELTRLERIPASSKVYLWFETDLFCQVNLWFTISQLWDIEKALNLYLVLPYSHAIYGFGSMNTDELEDVFNEEINLLDFPMVKDLWMAYQSNDIHRLENIGNLYSQQLPFLKDSIQAHKDRRIGTNELGRPKQVLMQIIEELDTLNFGAVFQEFCKRESIYGFGDLQVKRLYDEILEYRSKKE